MQTPRAPNRSVRYRRPLELICYWDGRRLIFENYSRQIRVRGASLIFDILNQLERWRSARAIEPHFQQLDSVTLRLALEGLVRYGLLERSDRPPHPGSGAMKTWKNWNPAAGLLHFSMKDVYGPLDLQGFERRLRERARRHPPPPAIKRILGAQRIELPAPVQEGEFPRVLLARRTWRRFSRRPLPLSHLATLLGLTFGVQWWLKLPAIGRVALKTSPSAGARHPIEAYVLAMRVTGLERGLYHYVADAHRLELVRRGATPRQACEYLAGQWWFGAAAAVVLMTAVFPRSQWKYPSPRAYRTVILDAGHICQTFCLVATWLGLAPFSTMALADSRVEHDLKVDGVTESAIYAAGVGLPAEGAEWAAWPARSRGIRLPNPRLAG